MNNDQSLRKGKHNLITFAKKKKINKTTKQNEKKPILIENTQNR